jgi:hypothetical protein
MRPEDGLLSSVQAITFHLVGFLSMKPVFVNQRQISSQCFFRSIHTVPRRVITMDSYLFIMPACMALSKMSFAY